MLEDLSSVPKFRVFFSILVVFTLVTLKFYKTDFVDIKFRENLVVDVFFFARPSIIRVS